MRSALLVTYGPDEHASLVSAALAAQDHPVLLFDTQRYRRGCDVALTAQAGRVAATLTVDGCDYDGDAFSSVLFRNVILPRAPEITDPEARKMVESERRAALNGAFWAMTDALWLNHPHANQRARSKLQQLRLAATLGFQIPDTLVSDDPQRIRDQFRRWDGAMIAKLAGGQIVADAVEAQYVVYTTALTAEDLTDDDALSACPALYQRRIPKAYEVRATLVGDEIFACRIDPNDGDAAVDWRVVGTSALALTPIELPSDVAAACRALMRRFELEIAGIDLIVTPSGETVFLEINAAGQWAWVEQGCGLPIAAAVARRMIDAARLRT